MTVELWADLHIHSKASPDGCLSVEEITAQAAERGLGAVAICDHDQVPEHWEAPEGVLVIPGVEISTDRGHLLGLFVTKPVESRDFFRAAAEIHSQGGLTVMAHPFGRSVDPHRLDDCMEALDGVEAWNGRAERKNPQANKMAMDLARRYGKWVTAGSDAHVGREIGNGAVLLPVREPSLDEVKKTLQAGTAKEIRGRRGLARDVARGQLTKRRRTGSGPLAWGKTLLFALSCCLRDWSRKGDAWYAFTREAWEEGEADPKEGPDAGGET